MNTEHTEVLTRNIMLQFHLLQAGAILIVVDNDTGRVAIVGVFHFLLETAATPLDQGYPGLVGGQRSDGCPQREAASCEVLAIGFRPEMHQDAADRRVVAVTEFTDFRLLGDQVAGRLLRIGNVQKSARIGLDFLFDRLLHNRVVVPIGSDTEALDRQRNYEDIPETEFHFERLLSSTRREHSRATRSRIATDEKTHNRRR